jgi:hypothetical protein
LSSKNKKYKQKLEKEEVTKKQQMKILCKTQEISLLEKDKLIGSLQGLVDEQENRILELEQGINGQYGVSTGSGAGIGQHGVRGRNRSVRGQGHQRSVRGQHGVRGRNRSVRGQGQE